ncbi:hypothetical protein DM01DRAFT_1377569 [Hesseltinella vesiculosa]|uniref:Uncharacterized protein n=1 Tax=Hesseltinella vesiculosa TaxID=101127 RepID=A0A1X2G783_9FUNG|nr:hypothetical protein DM01DRAFT_1377569 [Hesseltinella vesiculosa]
MNGPSLSNEKLGSLLFGHIAVAFITQGNRATLDISVVKDILEQLEGSSASKQIVQAIIDLYGENETLSIIGSAKLNSRLIDLVGTMSLARENEKKLTHLTKAFHH